MTTKQPEDKKKKKKDLFEEVIDILNEYEEGMTPRTGKDYEM